MSLSSYLKSKYLTAEPAPSSAKKRNRKDKKLASTGLTIAEDDVSGWSASPRIPEAQQSDGPVAVTTGASEFRKVKTNAWKKVGVSPSQSKTDEADEVIAQAVAENIDSQQKNEQEPIIVDEGIAKLENGSHAGLQSASAISRQLKQRTQEELAAWKEDQKSRGSKGSAETVYRDATGRRIDLIMRRQEIQRETKLKAEKEKEEKEALNGDIQRVEKENKRRKLDDVRFMPLTRSIDDEVMNRELKKMDRWNDPASKFLGQKKGDNISGKPLYVGAAAPNRYGIRPGHRWDGVDRGNGWEAERFKALNRVTRIKELDYSWQVDE